MNTSDYPALMIRYNHVPDGIIFICDVIMVLTIIVGIIGNASVGYCILHNKSLRTYINATLVSSSMANVIGCVCFIPLRIYLYTVRELRENADTLCDVVVFFRTFCDTINLFMLSAVSYERYQCVAFPFKKGGRIKRTVLFICVSWIVALVVSIISAVYMSDSALYDRCFPHFDAFLQKWGYHDAFVIFPVGLVSLLIIFLFYGLIIFTLYKHSMKMNKRFVKKKKQSRTHPIKHYNGYRKEQYSSSRQT